MAFEGWLFKINGRIFPNKLIARESYQCTPDQIMDLDPYRDGDGLFHRTALPHTATSIEFSTPHLRMNDVELLNTFLTKENRIKCEVDYWNPNTFSYASGTFYIADVAYGFVDVDEMKNTSLHKPIKVTITEY